MESPWKLTPLRLCCGPKLGARPNSVKHLSRLHLERSSAGPSTLGDALHEARKEPAGVVRPRRGFRMILDREDRQLAMSQSLDGPVVEVDVRHLERRRSGDSLLRSGDGEAVV